MFRSTCFLVVSLWLCSCSEKVATVDAAAKTTTSSPWVEKSYGYSEKIILKSQGKYPVEAPSVPLANASKEEIASFLKKSHEVVNAVFEQTGYAPPPGSLFAFDPEGLTLVARTTENYHVVLQAFAERSKQFEISNRVRPNILAYSFHILEADGALIRREMDIMGPSSDHSPSLKRLSVLADEGKAKRITSLAMEGRIGQRARLTNSIKRPFAASYKMEKDGTSIIKRDDYRNGTDLEMEVVLDDPGERYKVNFALHHDFAPPTERRVRLSGNIAGRPADIQLTDFHNARVNSQISMSTGTTTLLGIWKPEKAGDKPPLADILQAAFLRVDAPEVAVPMPHPLLQKWVESVGQKIIPIPKDPPPETAGLPEGMIARLFKISPEFFQPNSDARLDAFAAEDPVRLTAAVKKEFVIQFDVPRSAFPDSVNFPEGSSAIFDDTHGILSVINEPGNMAAFKNLRPAVKPENPVLPVVVNHTAHIIQAEGALIRKWVEEARKATDHANVWKFTEEAVRNNQASIIRSMWIGASSGQRARMDCGSLLADVSADLNNPKAKGENETSTTPGANPTTGGSSKDAPDPFLSGNVSNELSGVELEIESIIMDDSRHITLNLAMKSDVILGDPKHASASEPSENTTLLAAHGETTSGAQCSIGTTMEPGIWRMVAVWKPKDTAEIEGKDLLQAMFVRCDLPTDSPTKE